MNLFKDKRTQKEIEISIQIMENKLLSSYYGKGSVSFYQMMSETYKFLDISNSITEQFLS